MKKIETSLENRDWKNLLNFSDKNIEISPIKLNPITSIRKVFWSFIKYILHEQKKVKRSDWNTWNLYYDSFKQTTNWEILINPEFKIVDNKLVINTEIWFYESYHAFNGLKNWLWDNKIDFNNSVNYKVLSAWVIMYHRDTNSFYLFKRPENSQEAPGEIDLIWWCMNTRDWIKDEKICSELYVVSRMKTKAWLDVEAENLKFLWVQEFTNRWFYNLVYLYYLNDNDLALLKYKWNLSQITGDKIEEDKKQDNPGWAWLTLALEYLEKNKE